MRMRGFERNRRRCCEVECRASAYVNDEEKRQWFPKVIVVYYRIVQLSNDCYRNYTDIILIEPSISRV
jgi:hypothetical protein